MTIFKRAYRVYSTDWGRRLLALGVISTPSAVRTRLRAKFRRPLIIAGAVKAGWGNQYDVGGGQTFLKYILEIFLGGRQSRLPWPSHCIVLVSYRRLSYWQWGNWIAKAWVKRVRDAVAEFLGRCGGSFRKLEQLGPDLANIRMCSLANWHTNFVGQCSLKTTYWYACPGHENSGSWRCVHRVSRWK